MAEAWIVGAARTPIGRFLGGLSGASAVFLGKTAALAALIRSKVDPDEVDEAIVGCVLQAGLGQAPARQVALGAGLLAESSALTVNMVCGSGLRAVMLAAQAIQAGAADLVLAGGIESMSQAPHLLRNGRSGWKLGNQVLLDSMQFDGLHCSFADWPMGMAAERTAKQCGLARESLDAAALESHRRAVAAQHAGAFAEEIAPVSLPNPKGVVRVEADETPMPDTSAEKLARLKPVFIPEGVVTAGNASSLSDGAAMLVVASERAARRLGAEPMARVVSSAIAGVDPRDLFLAPAVAVPMALARANLSLEQIDLFEINEAFAAQHLACVNRLEIDPERVNVHGGAIALGHPIGASGARVLTTLLYAMRRHEKQRGCASLCLGGGNAVAMVVERP